MLAAPRRRWSRTEQLALALEQPGPGGGPGACFRYSDTGYVLLGEIVERVTREPLGVAVRRLLRYELLGLRHTWWEDDEPGASLHGRLAMVLPMGPAWAWGHLGYWGCGVAHCPSLGVTVAATVNQAYPADPAWRTQLVSRLGCVAVELAMTCPTGRSTNPAGTRQPLAMSTSLPTPRLAGSSR